MYHIRVVDLKNLFSDVIVDSLDYVGPGDMIGPKNIILRTEYKIRLILNRACQSL